MAQLFTLEPPRLKSVSLSVVLGDGPAEALQQLAYLIGITPKDKKHFHEGRVWVWNTYSDWHYQSFATMSTSTIKRHFAALVDWGLVLKGEFNDIPTDRTLWWTIDWEAYRVLDDFLTQIFDSFKDPLGKDRRGYIETLKRVGAVFQHGIADKLGISKPIYTEGRTERHLPKWTIERTILAFSRVSEWHAPESQNGTLSPETTPETTLKDQDSEPAAQGDDTQSQNGTGRKRDLIFDHVALGSWGLPLGSKCPQDKGGRVGKISAWLHKQGTPEDGSQVGRFYNWHSKARDYTPPRDLTKFKEDWLVFEELDRRRQERENPPAPRYDEHGNLLETEEELNRRVAHQWADRPPEKSALMIEQEKIARMTPEEREARKQQMLQDIEDARKRAREVRNGRS